MTLGSLFDGSGTAPLSAEMLGINPLWASEIEPFPIRVTTKQLPKMKHYGDIGKMDGANIEPVDIITFGSPCQDLSVAGKRAGIQDGERSNLFFEAVRIIKEMRKATNGEYPKYAVWENVPGAFSSNKGRDFHAVLEAFCSVCDDAVSIPEPYDKKRTKLVWNKAGEVVGDNYSVAWRTLDAQYWGVPQRRKRIYLVADFTGRCAGEILFKPEGLRGDMSQSNEAGQKVTVDAVGGVDGSVRAVGIDGYNFALTGDKAATVGVNCGISTGRNGVIESVDGSSGNRGQLAATVISSYGTKWNGNAGAYNGENFVLQKPGMVTQQGGAEIAENLCPTITAAAGMSGNNQPVIALQANGIDRADTAGCNGCGWRENESYTLNTIDRHAVCYQEKIGALQASDYKGVGNQYVCEDKLIVESLDAKGNGDGETVLFEPRSPDGEPRVYGDIRPTLNTAQGGQRQPCIATPSKPPRKYIVRRLTPLECARLQGFPPDWCAGLETIQPTEDDISFWSEVWETHRKINGVSKKPKSRKQIIKWLQNPHSDSAEYKMWGNGMALPCVLYVLQGIKRCLNDA